MPHVLQKWCLAKCVLNVSTWQVRSIRARLTDGGCVFSRQERKSGRRNDQVQDALLDAHGTVAIEGLQLVRNLDSVAHGFAMTAAFERDQILAVCLLLCA